MKEIIKTTEDGTELYFAIFSRKEVAEVIKDIYTEIKDSPEYAKQWLSDSSITWTLDDGTYGELSEDDITAKKPPVSRIKNFTYDAAGHQQFFFGNYEIVENQKYGDFDLIEK